MEFHLLALFYLTGNCVAAREECKAFFEAGECPLFYLIGKFVAAREECKAFFEAGECPLF